MAVRRILFHPDRGLRAVARTVATVDSGVLKLVDDLAETMYDARGIGLAATQVGVASRVFVTDCDRESEERNPLPMINPEIMVRAEELEIREEGCLSIPEVYEEIERPAWVEVRYLDREGTETEERFEGIQAACIQHELDHLDGKLIIDYLGPVKRRLITNRMRKWKRNQKREDDS